MAKQRKIRGDIKIGNLEKKLGLEPGSIRNPDGSDARSDKTLKKLREEFKKAVGPKVKSNPHLKSGSVSKSKSSSKKDKK